MSQSLTNCCMKQSLKKSKITKKYIKIDSVYIVFSPISTPGDFLMSKLESVTLIGALLLKEGDAYFKLRGIIHLKFQNFIVFSFKITLNNYHYGM